MESQAQRTYGDHSESSESGNDDHHQSDSMSRTNSDSDDDDGHGNAEGESAGAAARKKRERRSKDDHTKRNYICGCGKKYLSYAALYTHTKVKHGGSFPEGTVMLNKKKQGRPKVVLS